MFITVNCLPISPGKTGIGAYAANLVESLSRYPGGHRYALICGQDETLLPDLDAEAFSLVPVEVRDWTWCQLQLPALLEETAADVFLSPFFTSPVVKSCPSVVTLHDMIPLAKPELTPPDFREYFEATIDQSLALADRVITVSEHARSDIVRFRPEAEPKVRVVHQAVSARFRPVEEAELAGVRKELELETPYILYVGSIEERKNIGGLLEAFGQLPQKDDLRLVLCGRENTDGYDLEGRVQAAGLEGKVVHLGYVKDEQLPALYSGCSAFMFPSYYEGFGLPALEAMACGALVVASNVTSLPEVYGDAALLVDPSRPEEIAAAVDHVLRDDGLRSELSRKGLARAREFSQKRFASEVLAICAEVVERP